MNPIDWGDDQDHMGGFNNNNYSNPNTNGPNDLQRPSSIEKMNEQWETGSDDVHRSVSEVGGPTAYTPTAHQASWDQTGVPPPPPSSVGGGLHRQDSFAFQPPMANLQRADSFGNRSLTGGFERPMTPVQYPNPSMAPQYPANPSVVPQYPAPNLPYQQPMNGPPIPYQQQPPFPGQNFMGQQPQTPVGYPNPGYGHQPQQSQGFDPYYRGGY